MASSPCARPPIVPKTPRIRLPGTRRTSVLRALQSTRDWHRFGTPVIVHVQGTERGARCDASQHSARALSKRGSGPRRGGSAQNPISSNVFSPTGSCGRITPQVEPRVDQTEASEASFHSPPSVPTDVRRLAAIYVAYRCRAEPARKHQCSSPITRRRRNLPIQRVRQHDVPATALDIPQMLASPTVELPRPNALSDGLPTAPGAGSSETVLDRSSIARRTRP